MYIIHQILYIITMQHDVKNSPEKKWNEWKSHMISRDYKKEPQENFRNDKYNKLKQKTYW